MVPLSGERQKNMKMVLFELQRVLRARLLPIVVVFVVASGIAYAINEFAFRYAGSSQLSLNLGEIARTATSLSTPSAEACAGCATPEPGRIVSAVQFAIDSTSFWERVANDVLQETDGVSPELPFSFGRLDSERALAAVTGDARPDNAITQLAQDLRASVSIDLLSEDGELHITLYRADRETAILVFRSLDFAVRDFVVGEITGQFRRELVGKNEEIELLRAFDVNQTVGTGYLDWTGSDQASGDDGPLEELENVLPSLRSSSANLRDILHLDAILRGETPDIAVLQRVSEELLPRLETVVEAFAVDQSNETALRSVLSARSDDIEELRDRFTTDVTERRAEVTLLFDEIRLRNSIALNDIDLARQDVQTSVNEIRLTQQVEALQEIIERAQTAILSTSRFAEFRFASGVRPAVLIGAGIALVYFLWMLAQQFGMRTITTANEVRDLSVPILGEVPAQPDFTAPIASEGGSRDNLIMARAMRNIRSSILASSPKAEHLSILVTSSEMDEGKSFIARELAWAFSTLENRRVLLIAADYRRIVPMEGLKKLPKHTLADLMLGTNPDDEIDLLVPELGFEYLPARPIDLDPSDLLSSPRYDQLMAKLREEFDVIVIDGPPVLPVSDSVNLARCADITVFAVRHDHTLVSRVIEGLTRLRMAGVKPIAAVLSRSTHKDEDHDGYLAYIRRND